MAVTRMAHAYREKFHKDFMIDLVGYRRFGHNEGDEPAYTQPVMYEIIRDHPTVRELWAQELERRGVIEDGEAEEMFEKVMEEMAEVQKKPSDELDEDDFATDELHTPLVEIPETAVSADKLSELNGALLEPPEGFTPNSKLERLFQKNRGRPRTSIDLGARRGPGLRLAAGGRHPHPAHRAGHGARDLLPAPRASSTTPRPTSTTSRCRTCRRPGPPSRSTTARSRRSR